MIVTLCKSRDLSGVLISHLTNEGGFKSHSMQPWKFFGTNLSSSTYVLQIGLPCRISLEERELWLKKNPLKHWPCGSLGFPDLNIQVTNYLLPFES